MTDFSHVSVILPCPAAPDPALLCGLAAQGFGDILLISDAAEPSTRDEIPNLTILPHPASGGRGDALKAGITHCLAAHPECCGIITAEPGNTPEEIAACAEKMLETGGSVLTAREISNLSLLRRWANILSCLIFRIFVGISLQDTFSGLRAYPRHMASRLLTLPGSRFEWETNCLVFLQQEGIPFDVCQISCSESGYRFRWIRDLFSVYYPIFSRLLRYIFSSLLSSVVDEGMYAGLSAALHTVLTGFWLTAIPSVSARIVSSLLNFYMNKVMVFSSTTDTKTAFLRYCALAVPQMLMQMLLTFLLTWLLRLREDQTLLRSGVHFFVMCVLFIFSFLIQKYWVFSSKQEKDG